jgi:polyphenol oxidase
MNLLIPDWPAPANIKAFSTYKNDQQQSAYGSLATHTGDELSIIATNRNTLIQSLNTTAEAQWLNQTHSNIVHHAQNIIATPNADACYTQENQLICTVLTADCVPILLCNLDGTEVASVHAGWRGLAQNIIQSSIKDFKCPPQQILAWIGPCISQPCYSVDQKLVTHFHSIDPNLSQYFKRSDNAQYHADLVGIAQYQLEACAIGHITSSNLCTHSDKRFFSWRRGQCSGRQASGIWIKPDCR